MTTNRDLPQVFCVELRKRESVPQFFNTSPASSDESMFDIIASMHGIELATQVAKALGWSEISWSRFQTSGVSAVSPTDAYVTVGPLDKDKFDFGDVVRVTVRKFDVEDSYERKYLEDFAEDLSEVNYCIREILANHERYSERQVQIVRQFDTDLEIYLENFPFTPSDIELLLSLRNERIP